MRFFLAKEVLSKYAGQLGFSHSSWADKHEGTFGPSGGGKTCFANHDPLDHGRNDMILAADDFMQVLFEMSETVEISQRHDQIGMREGEGVGILEPAARSLAAMVES